MTYLTIQITFCHKKTAFSSSHIGVSTLLLLLLLLFVNNICQKHHQFQLEFHDLGFVFLKNPKSLSHNQVLNCERQKKNTILNIVSLKQYQDNSDNLLKKSNHNAQKNYLAIWYFFHGLIENTNIPQTNDTCF